MKWFAVACTLALVVGGGWLDAQDSVSKKCGAADILCPQKGACKAQCRTICDNVGRALKAVQARTAVILKDRLSKVTSACVTGTCATSACPCDSINKKLYRPLLKERVSKAFKNWKSKVYHQVKVDGKAKPRKVLCTFLKKDCAPCVNEMAIAAAKKLEKYFPKR